MLLCALLTQLFPAIVKELGKGFVRWGDLLVLKEEIGVLGPERDLHEEPRERPSLPLRYLT